MKSLIAYLSSPLPLPFRMGRLAAGVGVFVLFVLFAGMSRAAFATRGRLEQIRTDLALLEQKQRARFAFADMARRRRTDIERIQQLFVDPERPLNFIEYVEELGRRTGTQIALGAESPKEGERALVLRITAEGSDRALRTLHALLEAAPYAIRQERVSFQRIEERSESAQPVSPSGRLTATIRVSTR